jgi:alkaline phosphatase D
MMKRIFNFYWQVIAALLFCSPALQAQTVLEGPFCGGVKSSQAKIFVRTSTPTPFELVLAKDSLFSSLVTAVNASSDPGNDNSAITLVSGLEPDTRYFYKVRINNVDASEVRRFDTAPANDSKPNFSFAFGSCQSPTALPPIEPIYSTMSTHALKFFLQCGDWGYPDTTDLGNDDFFALDYARVMASYRARYQGSVTELMRTTPFDYIYDDHDYMNDNASKQSSSSYGATFSERPFSLEGRFNSIKAYDLQFPHYELVDTSHGIYHSFRWGNVEVFMLDNRSSRSPNLNSLKLNTANNTYEFDPPPGHTILGAEQMNWLLDGLKNSTATWKFIVGGVSFNKGYRRVINELSGNPQLQNLNVNAIPGVPPGTNVKSVLGGIVDTWAGFPEDQNRLLTFLQDNKIKNVVFLSSDSHTAAMDDGQNAGIPELMVGNLNITNSRLAQLMDQVKTLGPVFGITIESDLNVWNSGAQGVGNNNLKNCFGKIDIFGNDSIALTIIDQDNQRLARLRLRNEMLQDTTNEDTTKNDTTGNDTTTFRRSDWVERYFKLYPNPATDQLTIELPTTRTPTVEDRFLIYDVLGRPVRQQPANLYINRKQVLDVKDLPKGYYYLILHQPTGNMIKSFKRE